MEKYSVPLLGLLGAALMLVVGVLLYIFAAIGIATVTGWSYWVIVPLLSVWALFNLLVITLRSLE